MDHQKRFDADQMDSENKAPGASNVSDEVQFVNGIPPPLMLLGHVGFDQHGDVAVSIITKVKTEDGKGGQSDDVEAAPEVTEVNETSSEDIFFAFADDEDHNSMSSGEGITLAEILKDIKSSRGGLNEGTNNDSCVQSTAPNVTGEKKRVVEDIFSGSGEAQHPFSISSDDDVPMHKLMRKSVTDEGNSNVKKEASNFKCSIDDADDFVPMVNRRVHTRSQVQLKNKRVKCNKKFPKKLGPSKAGLKEKKKYSNVRGSIRRNGHYVKNNMRDRIAVSRTKAAKIKTERVCHDSMSETDDEDGFMRINTRALPSALVKAMTEFNEDQRTAVEELGFGDLLELGVRRLPSKLGYWLVQQFNTHDCCIYLPRNRTLHISPKDVNLTLGFPMGDRPVPEERLKQDSPWFTEWKRNIQVRDPNLVTTKHVLHRMLHVGIDGGEQFKRDFMVILVTYLCDFGTKWWATLSFFDALEDLSRVREYDWCSYLVLCLVKNTDRYGNSNAPTRFFGGPIMFLILLYADRMVIKGPHYGPRLTPTMHSWNDDKLRKLCKLEIQYGAFGHGFLRGPPSIRVPNTKMDVTGLGKNGNDNEGPSILKDKVDVARSQEDEIQDVSNEASMVLKAVAAFRENLARVSAKYPDSEPLHRLNESFNQSVGQAPASPDHDSSSLEVQFWRNTPLLTTVDTLLDATIKKNSTPVSEKVPVSPIRMQDMFDIGISTQPIEVESVISPLVGKNTVYGDVGQEHEGTELGNRPRSLNEVHEFRIRSLGESSHDGNIMSPDFKRCTDVIGDLTENEVYLFEWLLTSPIKLELPIVLMDGSSVYKRDLQTLGYGILFDNSVVNLWCHFLNLQDERKSARSASRICFTVDISRRLQLSNDPKHVVSQLMFEVDRYKEYGIDITKKELVFFAVVTTHTIAFTHFYVVCMDKKRMNVSILDNLKNSVDYNIRYHEIPERLRDLYADYVYSNSSKLSSAFKAVKPICMQLPWASETNVVDCGIFTMWHMEAFDGGEQMEI